VTDKNDVSKGELVMLAHLLVIAIVVIYFVNR